VLKMGLMSGVDGVADIIGKLGEPQTATPANVTPPAQAG